MLSRYDTPVKMTPNTHAYPHPLAESHSTEASTMHGVRLAVACSVHGDQRIGSLRFVVSELQQTHRHVFHVARSRRVISASKLTRLRDGLRAYYKSAIKNQRSSAKVKRKTGDVLSCKSCP